MRPLVPVLVTLSLAAALGSATVPAVAAGESCQGQPATVVGPGDPHGFLYGTGGNDVIVIAGARYVEAGGGGDLICITLGYSDVDAGDGNDTVIASPDGSTVELGTGSDRFVGSTGRDAVSGGIGFYRSDVERDAIDTGPRGANEDTVWSGKVGVPNSDQVHMSWGRLSWNGSATRASDIDGGAGSLLEVGTDEKLHLTIDNVAATLVQRPQPVLEIPGFTRFLLSQPKGLKGFTFRGTGRNELLSTSYAKSPAGSKVDLGGGDDELSVSAWRESRSSSYRGGRGNDLVNLRMAVTDDLDLDLRRGRLSTGKGRKEVTVRSSSFESAQVKARDIELIGTAGPNDIELHGCRARVKALGGKDDVSTFIQGPDAGPIICRDRRMSFDGGPGKDALVGSDGPDRLIGGPGRDSADGREGRDTCQAEERVSCEVRG